MNANVAGKIIPDKIHVLSIKVFKSNIETTEDFLSNPINPQGFRFGISQKSIFDFSNNQIRIVINILLQGMKSEDDFLGIKGEYGIDFIFTIDNLDDFVSINEQDKKQVSGKLGATLMGIAYSTARGIVFERTQGTYLNGIIFPVLDPAEILKYNTNLVSNSIAN